MASRTDSPLIVVGSGPMTGRAVAALFAQKRYNNVVVISRNQARLDEDKSVIESTAGHSVNVKTYSVDVTDEKVYSATLKEVGSQFGTPETVFFNAARVQPSTLLEEKSEDVVYELKINAIALYNTATWILPQMIELGKKDPSARPSLIVANSFLGTSPLAQLFSLSMAKAAQRSLVQSMAQVYGKEVHIGFVTIAGLISPEKNNVSPKNIAKEIWDFFSLNEKRSDVELYIKDD